MPLNFQSRSDSRVSVVRSFVRGTSSSRVVIIKRQNKASK